MRRRELLAVLVALTVVAALRLDGQARSGRGRTNTYYVAADTVTWDYTPSGINQVSGQPFDSVERPFVEPGRWHIGRLALKAIYREYTDSTFTRLKARPPEWQYLGILGPLLRAEVGDTIRVVFRNHLDIAASMHPHGVFYTKESEGAPYAAGPGQRELTGNAVITRELGRDIASDPYDVIQESERTITLRLTNSRQEALFTFEDDDTISTELKDLGSVTLKRR